MAERPSAARRIREAVRTGEWFRVGELAKTLGVTDAAIHTQMSALRRVGENFDKAGVGSDIRHRLATAPSRQPTAKQRRRPSNVLAALTGPMTIAEVADKAGVAHRTARDALWRLKRDGKVLLTAPRTYAPIDAPRPPIDAPRPPARRLATERPAVRVRPPLPQALELLEVRAISLEDDGWHVRLRGGEFTWVALLTDAAPVRQPQ